MRYRLVIFDLDGTLCDTLEDLADSVNQALRKHSLPTHAVDSFRQKVGDGSRTMVLRSLPADHQDLVEVIQPEVLAYYHEHFCDKTRAYPGVMEMVEELKKAGLRLAVLSNKPDRFTRLLVERVFGREVFDRVAGQQDGVPLKPDPIGALRLAEELGVSVAETAYVGDTAVDMQTARRAGMFAIGVTWGFRSRDELIENGSEALIDHPRELLGYVERGA